MENKGNIGVEGYPPQYQPQQGYVSNAQGYGSPHVMIDQPAVVPMVIQTVVRPQDYLVLSIVSCFFCWPMAICAIIFSNNSRKSSDASDFQEATRQGRTARNIAIGAIVCGIIITIVAVVVRMTVFTTRIHYHYSHFG